MPTTVPGIANNNNGNRVNQIDSSNSSSGMNNNSSSSGKGPEISPFVVSLSRDGGRRINRNHLLPPLAGEPARTPTSNRKNSSRNSSSKNHRHYHQHHGLHRIPHPKSKGSGGTKRSHSAAASSLLSTPVNSVPSSPSRKSFVNYQEPKLRHHPGRSTPKSSHRSNISSAIIAPGSEAYLRSPKSSRNRVNKIESVRILRARPLFYPMVKERYSGGSPSSGSGIRVRSRAATAAPSTISQLAALELPYPGLDAEPRHHVLGQKISLKADPKRKRKGLVTAEAAKTTSVATPSSAATSVNL